MTFRLNFQQKWSNFDPKTDDPSTWGNGNYTIPLRALWVNKETPRLVKTPSWDSWAVMQIPYFSFLANKTFDELDYMNLAIQMEDPEDVATIDQLVNQLSQSANGAEIQVSNSIAQVTARVRKMLNQVFYGLIGVTMFLCFFSLAASMSANLFEQKKEVGVLRAIGLTKCRVRLLYFYEALVLVLTSSSLGVLIGTIVGYSMLLQFNLFLQAGVTPFFPWRQLVLVFAISLVCAFVSTWGPATNLTNRSVAAIFRLV